MKTKPEWVHEPDDGRGPREVFVDGVKVHRCVYADTRRGFARFLTDGLRHEIVRGQVQVRPRERSPL